MESIQVFIIFGLGLVWFLSGLVQIGFYLSGSVFFVFGRIRNYQKKTTQKYSKYPNNLKTLEKQLKLLKVSENIRKYMNYPQNSVKKKLKLTVNIQKYMNFPKLQIVLGILVHVRVILEPEILRP